MKAYLKRNGELMVFADNDTEAYALRRWWDNFNDGDNRSVLTVEYLPGPDDTYEKD